MKLKVDDIRLSRNLTIRELAELAHVSKSYLQLIESGQANPSLEIMCRLAAVLGVTLNDLVVCDHKANK